MLLLLLLFLDAVVYCCCLYIHNSLSILSFQIRLFNLQVAGLADGYLELGLKLLPDYAFQ